MNLGFDQSVCDELAFWVFSDDDLKSRLLSAERRMPFENFGCRMDYFQPSEFGSPDFCIG